MTSSMRPLLAAVTLGATALTTLPMLGQVAPDALNQLRGPAGERVRYEVFATSEALVAGDANGAADVYIRDLATGTVELVSRGPDGRPGPHGSEEPSVSGDGSFVAFVTRNALVAADDNALSDVYGFDRGTGEIFLISRSFDGKAANAPSSQPVVAWGGQYVAFSSPASNIVRGDDNYVSDVFLWTRATLIPRLVSLRSDGAQYSKPSFLPAISPAGVYVGFRTLERLFAEQPAHDFAYFVVEAPGLAGRTHKAVYWVDSSTLAVRSTLKPELTESRGD